jgi:hypothetical protein
MNNSTLIGSGRTLPSADWIAVGLAALGLILGRISLPFSGLLGLAVFGPAALREVGVLKDSDEWQRGITHRAGFHATLAMAVFVFLHRVLPTFERQYQQFSDSPGHWFAPTFLWETLVMVFLVSFLIQYWGPVQGTARILMGFSMFLAIDNLVLAVRHGMWSNVWPGVVSSALMFSLGLATRRWPRVMGGVLLLIWVTPLVLWANTRMPRSGEMAAGLTASLVHIFLIFGVTGVVLLTSRREEEP